MESELIPLDAIFILDPSGIPLFARYYQGDINKTDTTLLSGFFSALEIFVKTSLDGLLTDIGMTDNRFYFDRTSSDYIIIIIIGIKGKEHIEPETLELVTRLQKVVNSCLTVVKQTALDNMLSTEFLIENLGETMDSFLLESNFEITEEITEHDNYYDNLKSESIGKDELDRIIEEIKDQK